MKPHLCLFIYFAYVYHWVLRRDVTEKKGPFFLELIMYALFKSILKSCTYHRIFIYRIKFKFSVNFLSLLFLFSYFFFSYQHFFSFFLSSLLILVLSLFIYNHLIVSPRVSGPVGSGYGIRRLLLCRGVRHPPPTKQSDGEVLVMLEVWGMQSTSLLPLLPDPLVRIRSTW